MGIISILGVNSDPILNVRLNNFGECFETVDLIKESLTIGVELV